LPRLSDSFRSGLDMLAREYQAALSPAARSYLAGRGLDEGAIERYRIGEVTRDSEHWQYAGMICVPYLTKRGGVVSLKFRHAHECSQACSHPKYISPYPTRLYNTLAMDRADELGYIATTEGEFNAEILDYRCGVPAVGIPGGDTWQKHPEWIALFSGYRRVTHFTDNDDAGRKLASRISHDIRDAHTVTLESGKDVNEAYVSDPKAAVAEIRRKAGLDD
jgi:DNA primase